MLYLRPKQNFMVRIEELLKQACVQCISELYNMEVDHKLVQIQKTRKEFEGDITLVVFPFLKISKKGPEQTGEEMGKWLIEKYEAFSEFNTIKGFLNLSVPASYWLAFFIDSAHDDDFGISASGKLSQTVVVEYSSPNTNKPLHLGHIRNNLLGYSVSKILEANGLKVVKTNIVNDRGIHICKSMLAWKRWGEGITPGKSNQKGDHLVGDYYVKFDQEYKKQINELVEKGVDKDEAAKTAPLIKEAQEMLRKWESGDEETVKMWKMMNQWVYDGFDVTYKSLGVDFDKIYYESNTYKLGKNNVLEGLKKDVFFEKDDHSVWADLSEHGLDNKLLLRSDGTSVYMTQDIGTAIERHHDFNFNKHIYVVGNEQDHHFKVLPLLLKKLGYEWSSELYHLSYGMVELPEGKMKSREGTVVDADDLIEEMVNTAEEMSKELGKLEGIEKEEQKNIFRIIGLGALKYFILKVDPKKNMVFNPKESIDFNGNTGPFIQYTYARIQSLKRKAEENKIDKGNFDIKKVTLSNKEKELIKYIHSFPEIINQAAEEMSPALIANFSYEMVKEYNQFYHDFPVLKEENENNRQFRLALSQVLGKTIKFTD